ncbi:MAG: FHA domain-containing protein [Myxococcales bacterium]|nr:FHA domain-containing protein [Myxococcales bacterium]
MGRGPSQIGRAPAHLTVLPGGASGLGSGLDDLEEDRTTIEPEPPAADDEAPTPIAAASTTMDEPWEDGTTVAESGEKRAAAVDEPTVEDQARPLPPLQLVPGTATNATDPRALARLHVLGGSDQGRVFELRPGKDLLVGRAVDNDVCLTDIAVSRRHLELTWDGDAWVLRDRGSGNGTLINDRLEDGRCQLRDGDRIEIGNTVFRFDHPPSATRPTVTGWNQDDEEAATVAGRATGRTPSTPPPVDPRGRASSVTAAAASRQPPPPGPPRPRRASQTPEARPATVRGVPVASARGTEPPRPGDPAVAPGAPVMLGPIPGGSLSGPVATPAFPVAAAAMSLPMPVVPLDASGRPATTTALVEPRVYPAYPFVIAPDHGRRKRLLVGIGVALAVALIGVGAMLGGGEAPPAATTPAPVAAGAATGDEERDPAGTAAVGVAAAPGSSGGTAETAGPPTPAVVEPPPPTPAVVEPPPTPAVVEPPPPTPAVVEPPPPTPAVVEPPVVKKPPPPAVVKKPPPAVVKKPPPAVVKKPPVRVDNDDLLASKKPPATRGANHEKKADGLYRNKDWKSAAALLREQAAATEDAGEARRLRAMAADYETIGANLATGATLAKAKPADALVAFKKALTADRRAGGAHQPVIRENISKVAPAAAAAYMAKQNYPMAKIAADDAVNVGAGSNATVANVRASLERKAGELFASSQKLMKTQPDEAKSLLRTITKIVPADSPWYIRSYKILNQRKGAAADEDE